MLLLKKLKELRQDRTEKDNTSLAEEFNFGDAEDFTFSRDEDPDDNISEFDEDLPIFGFENSDSEKNWAESAVSRLSNILTRTWKRFSLAAEKIGDLAYALRVRKLLIAVGIGLIIIVIAVFLWSLHDVINLPVVIALSVAIGIIVISVISLRSERDLVEERLGRYEEGYQSFLDIEEETSKEDKRKTLDSIDKTISKRPFGERIRQRLDQADLTLTLPEYFAIHIIFVYLGVAISRVIFPDVIIVASIIGAFAYILPDIFVAAVARKRLRQFDEQFPYALELWSSSIYSGYTITQSIEILSKHTLNPVASEFKRVVIDLQLGMSIEDAFSNLQRRIPSYHLKLAIDAVYVHSKDGSPLDLLLSDVNKHIQKLWQIRLSNGYLAYAHDLMFPIIVAIIFIQSQILREYFSSVLQHPLSSTVFVLAYAIITIAMLSIGEAGKHLHRIEKRYNLPSYRTPAISTFIAVIRASSFVLFGYYHLLHPSLGIIIAWAWIMLLCLETPYAIIPIFILSIIIALQIRWQLNADELITIIQWDTIPRAIAVIVVIYSIVLIISVVVYINRIYLGRDPVIERLAQLSEQDGLSIAEVELSISFFQRVYAPILIFIGAFTARFAPVVQVEALKQKLTEAGSGIQLEVLIAQRLIFAIMFSIGTFYALSMVAHFDPLIVTICTLAATVAGSYIPLIYLNSLIRRRRKVVHKQLTDLLLALEMRLKGKSTTLSAIADIYESWNGVLGIVLGKAVKMSQLGASLEDAMKQIANEVSDVQFRYLSTGIIRFQNNSDALEKYIRQLREYIYQDEDRNIKTELLLYKYWHTFASQYLLWIGLVIWFVSPLIPP